jgi:hypothetical protein
VAAFNSEYPAWHHRELLFQEGVYYIFEVSAELDRKVLIFSLLINADNFAPKMITKMSCTRNPLGKIVVCGDAKFPPGETVTYFHQIARLLSEGITSKRVSSGRLDHRCGRLDHRSGTVRPTLRASMSSSGHRAQAAAEVPLLE